MHNRLIAVRALALCCALVALCPPLGVTAAAGNDPKPFPVTTSILRDNDAVYFVEGLLRIPRGVEVSVQKGIKIIGRGKEAALVVEGSLQIHGTDKKKVVLEGVTITSTPVFEDIQLDHCIFRKSGGVIIEKDQPADGKVFVEHTHFHWDTKFDVTLSRGNIDLGSVYSSEPVTIRAVTPDGKTENNVRVIVRDCSPEGSGALWGGLVIEGAKDVNVRRNLLQGKLARFVDCGKLTFDANLVMVESLEFRQSKSGQFGKSKMTKCDVTTRKIVVFSPSDGGSKDKFYIDKCWFEGESKKSRIHAEVISDAADSDENVATVIIKKLSSKPSELAGQAEKEK